MFKSIISLTSATITVMFLMGANTASPQDLPQPAGEIILEVTGNISARNSGDNAVFDREMLEGLGVETVSTTTAWTDGVMEFKGPRLQSVLDAVGGTGKTLILTALNDYQIELDGTEVKEIPVILAMKMNGKELRVRDKGPLWVVYPRDSYPEIAAEANNYKWIWQLRLIEVK